MRRVLSIVALLILFTPGAFAAAPIEDVTFETEEQAARYQELIEELRCPKCLNVNLAGSDAPIAALMRAETRKQVAEGRSNDEILDYWVARYGEFVLYTPPLRASTFLLWFGPLLLLIAGFFILWRMQATASKSTSETALSADEMRKLQVLLDDNKDAR